MYSPSLRPRSSGSLRPRSNSAKHRVGYTLTIWMFERGAVRAARALDSGRLDDEGHGRPRSHPCLPVGDHRTIQGGGRNPAGQACRGGEGALEELADRDQGLGCSQDRCLGP